jgi:PilZ domain-containing protein
MDKKEALSCPVCRALDVQVSHRRGTLERGPLTWLGILPFRCGQCQTRFYKFVVKDPRRRRPAGDTIPPVDLPRAPRWNTNLPAAVTVCQPGREDTVLSGVAVNASLEGVRLRLPTMLSEGSVVSVALQGGPSRLGSVRWTLAHGESEIIHGVRFQVPLERRGVHSQPFRRLRRRQCIRRSLMVLIGLAVIAIAAYGFVWWVEQFRTYYPKYYEPKDIERQGYEQQQRQEGPK